MAPHSQTKESPAKDFAENLRTVHLSLLAVCLALAVILFSPPPYAVRKANQDLRDIVDAVSEPLWPKTWLLDAGKEEAAKAASTAAPTPFFGGACQWPLPWHRPGGTSNVIAAPGGTPAVVVAGRTVVLTVNGPTWYIDVPRFPNDAPGVPNSLPAFSYYSGPPRLPEYRLNVPRNLNEFKVLWDMHPYIHCPRELGPEYKIFEKGHLSSSPLLWAEDVTTSGSVMAQLSRSQPFAFEYTSGSQGGFTMGIVPIASTTDLPLDSRAVFIRETGKNHWHDAEFSQAFPELEEMTSGFQDLDFAHLEKILRLQEKTSKEGMEAFGIRFPVENTARWGILLIIAIQIYFWMHLREYRNRAVTPPPVAWIGSYTQPTARIFFSLTAFLLPAAMVLIAATTVSLAERQWINVSLKVFAILMSMAVSGRAAYEYFRKPRLAASVA